MNNNYKLLALDIDNTLTNDIDTVPERNANAIRKAQEKGVYVTLATGRAFESSRSIWKQLDIKGPIVNFGGAIVMDTVSEKPVFESSISDELLMEIFEIAHELKIYAHFYQGNNIVHEYKHEYGDEYSKRLKLGQIIDPDIRSKHWQNIPKAIFIVESQMTEGLIHDMQEHFKGRLKVSGSSPMFVEFNHIDAHKGTGVKYIADSMGIDMKDVIAVGDNTLDLEMIKMAGLGIAVGDAKQEIIPYADVVAPPSYENAVEWIIDRYIL